MKRTILHSMILLGASNSGAICGEEGKAFIQTDPIGAEVWLLRDGEKPENIKLQDQKTNAVFKAPLGKNTFVIILKGYRPARIDLDIQGEGIHKPDLVRLRKQGVLVDVLFAEAGWRIYVGGHTVDDVEGKVAETPATIEMPGEVQDITLAKEGYQDIVKKITVPLGKSIEVKEQPQKGTSRLLHSEFANTKRFDIENLDYNTLTSIDQFNEIKGNVLNVDARSGLVDTRIDVKAGERYFVIPNPKDIWTAYDTTYDDFRGSRYSRGKNGLPYMALCYRVGGEKISVLGPIEGVGRLYLFANNDDLSRGKGSISVKIVKVK